MLARSAVEEEKVRYAFNDLAIRGGSRSMGHCTLPFTNALPSSRIPRYACEGLHRCAQDPQRLTAALCADECSCAHFARASSLCGKMSFAWQTGCLSEQMKSTHRTSSAPLSCSRCKTPSAICKNEPSSTANSAAPRCGARRKRNGGRCQAQHAVKTRMLAVQTSAATATSVPDTPLFTAMKFWFVKKHTAPVDE